MRRERERESLKQGHTPPTLFLYYYRDLNASYSSGGRRGPPAHKAKAKGVGGRGLALVQERERGGGGLCAAKDTAPPGTGGVRALCLGISIEAR